MRCNYSVLGPEIDMLFSLPALLTVLLPKKLRVRCNIFLTEKYSERKRMHCLLTVLLVPHGYV
jgi:hypothetical protein